MIFLNQFESICNISFYLKLLKFLYGNDKNEDVICGLQVSEIGYVILQRENIECFGKLYCVLRYWINEILKGCCVFLRKIKCKY